MKKQPKLTPWFPASVKPARNGPYEQGYETHEGVKPYPYAFSIWNGKSFVGCEKSADLVINDSSPDESQSLNDPTNFWRGVVRP